MVRIFALSHSNCPLKFNQDVYKTSLPKYLILALKELIKFPQADRVLVHLPNPPLSPDSGGIQP